MNTLVSFANTVDGIMLHGVEDDHTVTGILLPKLTIDDMKQVMSKIIDNVITRLFRELDLIEQWGAGNCLKSLNLLCLSGVKCLG